jgi:hypothetical protein
MMSLTPHEDPYRVVTVIDGRPCRISAGQQVKKAEAGQELSWSASFQLQFL